MGCQLSIFSRFVNGLWRAPGLVTEGIENETRSLDRVESHSVKISCSVLKVDVSVFADTAPNFFASRALSAARI